MGKRLRFLRGRTDSERRAELADLDEHFSRKEILALVRDMLTVLNGKSASLLTFNAIALASLSVWASNTSIDAGTALSFFHLCLDVVYLLFLLSSVVCLYNASVLWSGRDALSEDKILRYLRTRDDRTAMHRMSLAISLWAVGILIVLSVLHVAVVSAYALGVCADRQASLCILGRMDVK